MTTQGMSVLCWYAAQFWNVACLFILRLLLKRSRVQLLLYVIFVCFRILPKLPLSASSLEWKTMRNSCCYCVVEDSLYLWMHRMHKGLESYRILHKWSKYKRGPIILSSNMISCPKKRTFLVFCASPMKGHSCQWIFQVPVKGGRDYITP